MGRRWTSERLRSTALGRQFPSLRGRDRCGLLDICRRLGPIQSQVPRAPFVGLAARLPGVSHHTIVEAFDAYELIKTTSLRGTVHTTTREQYSLVDAVAQRTWAGPATTHFKFEQVTISDLRAEAERYCRQWRSRKDVVAHLRSWLAERDGEASAAKLDLPSGTGYGWGHSAIVRRPYDDRWDRRTDTLHRTARSFLEVGEVNPEDALVELARIHLSSFGPATRRDLAWWTGETLTRVDQAIRALGDELVTVVGVDGGTYLDLAAPPSGGRDPGTRLLPEYDGLLLGYAPENRGRFLDLASVDLVWMRANGMYLPTLLADGRLVASWKVVTTGRRTDIEITMLPREQAVSDADLTRAVADVERALDLEITDIRRQE